MRSVARLLSLSLLLAGSAHFAPAQTDNDPFSAAQASRGKGKTTVEFLSEVQSIAPGKPFDVAIKLTHPVGWHSYFINTGTPGVGLVLEPAWELPEGFEVERVAWPIPHLGTTAGDTTYGYEGTVFHLFTITPPAEVAEKEVTLKIAPTWQICDLAKCDREPGLFGPGDPYTVDLTVAEEAEPNPANADNFVAARAMLPKELPDELSLKVTRTDSEVTLSLSPASAVPEGTIHFYDDDNSLNAQSKPSVERTDEEVRWTIGRLKEMNPKRTGGVLSIGDEGYAVELEFADGDEGGPSSTPPATVDTHQAAPADTPEVLAEMAKLYKGDEKINYRTLDSAGKTKTTFWTALIGAFIGGMILNLMPCVFPVLGIKVMGFVEQAGSDKAKVRLHGLAFTAGLVVSMWVLAGALLFLKLSLGQDVNWGQQMGNPYFVASIVVLLFVLGLNLYGVFEMGLFMTSAGSGLQEKKGLKGSFFSGILTTLIATPCSGPFLGAAMGYTMAQPALIALFLFTVFALGIASPYLFLSFFPKLIEKLPRPGAWMETFKKTLSFAMFGTAAFFLQTFGAQAGVKGMSWLLMAMVVIGLALYFYGQYSLPHQPTSKRRVFGYAVPALIAGIGIWMAAVAIKTEAPETISAHTGGLHWEKWQPGKVEYRQSKKRIVWVDYTADW